MTHELPNGTNQLPDGWRVENLGDLVQFAPKVRSELLEQDAELSFVPMKAVAEVSGRVALDEAIAATAAKKKNLTYFEDGDVIFAKITPCMENGKIARPTGLLNGSAYGSTEFHVLRAGALVDGEFLRLFLVHDDFRHEAARAMTGAVGQRRVPRKYLEAYELQLPPLAEQGRIVEILDEHLGRLDTALEHVKIVREKAAQFRRSLLHAAFTGELTGHNPTTNQLPDGWVSKTLGDVSTKPQYGWTTKSEPGNDRLHYLRTTDITKGPVNWSTVPRCVTEPGDTERFLLKTGDIVVSRAGSVGCCALLGDVPPSVFASYLIRLRPLAPLNKTYVFWFLQSPAYWDAISEASAGIAVQNVNAKKLASIELPVPPPPAASDRRDS